MTSAEVEAYLQAVTEALSDLDPDVRADLLEDLPSHLAEVAAEGGGSLIDRLGDPSEYAAELRAAAVLVADTDRRPSRLDELSRMRRSGLAAVEHADALGGRLLGYPRAVDCLRDLRPGWWVVRGCLVAWLLAFSYGNRNGSVIPNFGNGYSHSSKAFGLVFLACCVLLSIRIGRASGRWSVGARRVLLAVSVLLAVYALRTAERTAQVSFNLTSSSADVVPVPAATATGAEDGLFVAPAGSADTTP